MILRAIYAENNEFFLIPAKKWLISLILHCIKFSSEMKSLQIGETESAHELDMFCARLKLFQLQQKLIQIWLFFFS